MDRFKKIFNKLSPQTQARLQGVLNATKKGAIDEFKYQVDKKSAFNTGANVSKWIHDLSPTMKAAIIVAITFFVILLIWIGMSLRKK